MRALRTIVVERPGFRQEVSQDASRILAGPCRLTLSETAQPLRCHPTRVIGPNFQDRLGSDSLGQRANSIDSEIR